MKHHCLIILICLLDCHWEITISIINHPWVSFLLTTEFAAKSLYQSLTLKYFCMHIQPLLILSTHHLVLSPDGHNSTGDGGNYRAYRMPLSRGQRKNILPNLNAILLNYKMKYSGSVLLVLKFLQRNSVLTSLQQHLAGALLWFHAGSSPGFQCSFPRCRGHAAWLNQPRCTPHHQRNNSVSKESWTQIIQMRDIKNYKI